MQNSFQCLTQPKDFVQVLLDADSCLLTAMLTPFGIYIFNIMAMDLSNSGDLFESSLPTCISDLPGCTNIADNIHILA